MLKPNISPRSLRIELSNDTFAKRKCCQVFAYESETFNRRRSNGISHSENGQQTPPQKLPFPLHDVDPHLIQECLGPPHAPPQTAATTVVAPSHTDAVVTMAPHKCVATRPAFGGTSRFLALVSRVPSPTSAGRQLSRFCLLYTSPSPRD